MSEKAMERMQAEIENLELEARMMRERNQRLEVEVNRLQAALHRATVSTKQASVVEFEGWLNARRDLPVSEVFHEVVRLFKIAEDSADASDLACHKAADTLNNFIERVTHWKEGKPDLHDAKMTLKAMQSGAAYSDVISDGGMDPRNAQDTQGGAA